MRHLAYSIIYASFFGLIGFAVYFTGSAAPLWALLLAPTVRDGEND